MRLVSPSAARSPAHTGEPFAMWQNRVLSNPRLKYLKQSIEKELEWFPKDVRFRFEHRREKMRPIPGPYLRFRVAGDYAIEWFHASGRESRLAFERALAPTGR